MKLKHLKSVFFLLLGTKLPLPGKKRSILIKLGGVKMTNPTSSYIGYNVRFDTVHPELIHIGNHVHITAGCVLLTHYLDTSNTDCSVCRYKKGAIYIGNDVFLGTNTIICNSIKIGNGAVIGAGSVVTKDIPDNEIWAGNPAKFIKVRGK